MQVKFHTNLDKYRGYTDLWPELPAGIVPRVGERVAVKDDLVTHFLNKELPIELEVVGVQYTESRIRVELHYTKHDVELRDKKTLFGY